MITINHWEWIRSKQDKIMRYAVENAPLSDIGFDHIVAMADEVMSLVEKQAPDQSYVNTDRKIILDTLETIDLMHRN